MSSKAATATSAVAAVTTEPSGASTIESAWLIQTWLVASQPDMRREAALETSSVRPNSAVPVRSTRPPRSLARSWAP